MTIRTTLDVPISLHQEIKRRAQGSNKSMRQVMIRCLEEGIRGKSKGTPVRGPLIAGKGKRGPLYPKDEVAVEFLLP